MPAAAESLHEHDTGLVLTCEGLDGGTFGIEQAALRVDDVEKIDQAGAHALIVVGGGAAGGVDGLGLGLGLLKEVLGIDEGILDLAEGDEGAFAVLCDRLFVASLGGLEVRAVASALEDGDTDAWAERPDVAFPAEDILDVDAFESGGSGEKDGGEERGLGDADGGASGGGESFGLGDVRTTGEEFRGQTWRRGRRWWEGEIAGWESEIRGSLAAEDGEGMFHESSDALDLDEFGFGVGDLGFGPRDIRLGTETTREACLAGVQEAAANGNGTVEGLNFGVEGTDLEIEPGDVSADGEGDGLLGGFLRFKLGLGGFVEAADPTPEVQFVLGAERESEPVAAE